MPIPTALKILRGNPGKRPLPANEPKPDIVIPDPPKFLDRVGRKEWKRITEQLYKNNMITELDYAVVAGYCQAFAIWIKATDKIAVEGMITSTVNGYLTQNPYYKILEKSRQDMLIFAKELGLSPVQRPRVSKIPTKKKKDKFADQFVK